MALIKAYELKNGNRRYEVYCYVGTDGTGKEKRIHKRGFIKEADAKRFAKNIESDVVNNKINTSFKGNMLLGDYLTEWLNEYKINVKEGSMIIYRYNVNHYLIPKIGHYQLSKYTYDIHQRFITSLFESGGKNNAPLSKNTVTIINATLSNALEKAVKLGFIRDNPTSHVEFPMRHLEEVKKPQYWTVEQTEKFLSETKRDKEPIWYPFFLTILDLGIRNGEAMALTFQDINFDKKTVSIRRTRLYRKEIKDLQNAIIVDSPKTNASIRELSMTGRLTEALKEVFNYFNSNRKVVRFNDNGTLNEEDFIFRYMTSNPRHKNKIIRSRSTNGAFARITKRANLPTIKIHDLRHTHAILMRESGAPLEDVQDTLGHKNIETTQIYATTTTKVIKRANDQYENYINKDK